MPRKLKKYYYLTKPGIIYGNALNILGGFLLAANGNVSWILLTYVLIGASLVIACGCILNNYIDRGIDQKMSRTKRRSLVSGEISPISALVYAGVIGLIGFSILILHTNNLVVYTGIFALISYVVIYGVAKRKTVHGTLVGSLPGAAPPVAGYVAARGQFDSGAVLLGLIIVFWQMAHFYCIAMYRYQEYKAAGLPVWPIVKGSKSTRKTVIWYIVAFCIACTLLSMYGYTGYIFLLVTLGSALAWALKGIRKYSLTDVEWGRKMFLHSLIVILVLDIMLSIDSLIL